MGTNTAENSRNNCVWRMKTVESGQLLSIRNITMKMPRED
jgi:hypothetical protein